MTMRKMNMKDHFNEECVYYKGSKESIGVLMECARLQIRKSMDYQNPQSRIQQADHYPRGCNTIIDMVHQKIVRMYSLIESAENSDNPPNFESIEDSAIDAINYLSFFVAYSRGKMDGQTPERDMFNRKIPIEADE